MPKRQLTDIVVQRLKAEGTYFDANLPAFGIRVGKNRKTWIVMRGKERRRIRIGHYPAVGLAEARRKAHALIGGPMHTNAPPFEAALGSFLELHGAGLKPRSLAEIERTLTRHFMPVFRKRPLNKITLPEVTAIIDGLMATPSEALHAFKDIRTFFRWCVPRYLPHSPIEGLKAPSRYIPRKRVLTEDELKAVWNAASDYPFGTIVRLLILTGQRWGEIVSLRWEYVDAKERAITLPETKSGRIHTFPYGDMVAEILNDVPRSNSTSLLFAGKDKSKAWNGAGKAKWQLDERLKLEPWTLHDLRRTFATNLAALNVAPHIVERLLNHASGTISGVAAIYNRFQYLAEMRKAIQRWEDKLAGILG